jgi:hypothetical protein
MSNHIPRMSAMQGRECNGIINSITNIFQGGKSEVSDESAPLAANELTTAA